MTDIATATVEALTAEVRVLMVGSRQVTLSVYRQLDHVFSTDIEPFGRVRADKNLPEGVIELVGARDGVLVRSAVSRPDWTGGSVAFDHWLLHTRSRPYSSGKWFPMNSGYPRLMWDSSAEDQRAACQQPRTLEGMRWPPERDKQQLYHWLEKEHEFHWARGDFCDMEALRAEWRADLDGQLTECGDEQRHYDEMKALPLIILAGLK